MHSLRQLGQVTIGLRSFFRDVRTHSRIHSRQKECRHGNALGISYGERQIPHTEMFVQVDSSVYDDAAGFERDIVTI